MENITSILAGIIAALPLAYTFFIWIGKKTVEKKIAESLLDFEHNKNKEIEKLRSDISNIFSRVSKIHEKEFEILPELWQKLQFSLGAVNSLVSILQEYIDVEIYHQEELLGYFSALDFKKYQIDEILSSNDRQKCYQKHFKYYQMKKANKLLYEFHDYVLLNKVFLDNDLYTLFNQADTILFKAYLIKISEVDYDNTSAFEVYKKVRNGVLPICAQIEKKIQSRLRFFEA
jgi:hypothetical protein